jgi:hypothetical protein
MKTDLPILEVERITLEAVKRRVLKAGVFSFGATDIDPKHLAVWFSVDTDAEKQALIHDQSLDAELRQCLHQAGYPEQAIPEVGFAFESQETVDRDYSGSWWYAIK